MIGKKNKLIFANQLRAFAALSVLFEHFNAVFWNARSTVAQYIGAPAVIGPNPWAVDFFKVPYLNFGPFGVAIFFLISGFVIPFSLQKISRLQFFCARILRIYPTYIISLLFALTVVWVSCRWWDQPFMWDTHTILQNLILYNHMTGTPSIDLVNWTLSVEVKFYFLCCLFAGYIQCGAVWPLLLFAIFSYVFNYYWHFPIGIEMHFVSFMFIGIMFNYLFRKLISYWVFTSMLSILCILFFSGWRGTWWPDFFRLIAPNYGYACLLFGCAYYCRSYFRNHVVLDFLADISYPLYVTHSLVGYCMMRYLLACGFSYSIIFLMTLAVVLTVAYGLHRLIEVPAINAAKRVRVQKLTIGVKKYFNNVSIQLTKNLFGLWVNWRKIN